MNNLRVRKWGSQQYMKNCIFHKLMCLDTYSKDYALKYTFTCTQVRIRSKNARQCYYKCCLNIWRSCCSASVFLS